MALVKPLQPHFFANVVVNYTLFPIPLPLPMKRWFQLPHREEKDQDRGNGGSQRVSKRCRRRTLGLVYERLIAEKECGPSLGLFKFDNLPSYRVPGILSSRLNGVPPTPLPPSDCYSPLWVQGGRHTRLRGRR